MFRTDALSLRLLIAAIFLVAHGGCRLFPDVSETPTNALALRPIVPPRDKIELEVWYVDRPVGDPLTGDALWGEIDQISKINVEDRFRLNEAGIRYGVAGTDLPKTLSALLHDRRASAVQRTSQVKLHLMSGHGGETSAATGELEVAHLPQPCRIRIPGRTSREVREYSAVRCVLHVTAQRIQEGWVRLEFVPEIHHGDARVRPRATNSTDWQSQESQQVEPLYDQRFSLELNLGEHVLIGAVGETDDSVGQYFFRGGQADPGQERLIVIRIQGLDQVAPVPVSDWSSPLR